MDNNFIKLANKEGKKALDRGDYPAGCVIVKDGKVWWKCLNCGYVYESEKALESCPACLHPKAFMQVREDNY